MSRRFTVSTLGIWACEHLFDHAARLQVLLGSFETGLGPLGEAMPPALPDTELSQKVLQAVRRPIPWNSLGLTDKLAEGAFGTVTKGSLFGTEVAVKQMKPGIAPTELIEECAIMHPVVHQNLVQAIGLSTDGIDKVGMVMEIMSTSLHDIMHHHGFTGMGIRPYVRWEKSLLAIVTDVAKGMRCLHANDLVHRDLKPLNVLLTPGWVGKVADFGEVKVLPGGQAALRCKGLVHSSVHESHVHEDGGLRIHGTAPYVSPEAASQDMKKAPPVGKPSDVWSFACLIAHCSAGRPPYMDWCTSSDDIPKLLQKLRNGKAKPLSQLYNPPEQQPGTSPPAKIPPLLLALAEDCTRFDQSKRPTFEAITSRLCDEKLIRAICPFDAEDEVHEAMRPPVRLMATPPKPPPIQAPPPPPPVQVQQEPAAAATEAAAQSPGAAENKPRPRSPSVYAAPDAPVAAVHEASTATPPPPPLDLPNSPNAKPTMKLDLAAVDPSSPMHHKAPGNGEVILRPKSHLQAISSKDSSTMSRSPSTLLRNASKIFSSKHKKAPPSLEDTILDPSSPEVSPLESQAPAAQALDFSRAVDGGVDGVASRENSARNKFRARGAAATNITSTSAPATRTEDGGGEEDDLLERLRNAVLHSGLLSAPAVKEASERMRPIIQAINNCVNQAPGGNAPWAVGAHSA